MTIWDLIGLLLFSAVSYVFYGMVKNCLDNGLTPGYTLDIFSINLASQFLISFTRYGWWIYSVVPGYLLYKLSGYAWGYISNINNKQVQERKKKKKKKSRNRRRRRGPKLNMLND